MKLSKSLFRFCSVLFGLHGGMLLLSPASLSFLGINPKMIEDALATDLQQQLLLPSLSSSSLALCVLSGYAATFLDLHEHAKVARGFIYVFAALLYNIVIDLKNGQTSIFVSNQTAYIHAFIIVLLSILTLVVCFSSFKDHLPPNKLLINNHSIYFRALAAVWAFEACLMLFSPSQFVDASHVPFSNVLLSINAGMAFAMSTISWYSASSKNSINQSKVTKSFLVYWIVLIFQSWQQSFDVMPQLHSIVRNARFALSMLALIVSALLAFANPVVDPDWRKRAANAAKRVAD